jgi:hypothetical protein
MYCTNLAELKEGFHDNFKVLRIKILEKQGRSDLETLFKVELPTWPATSSIGRGLQTPPSMNII